MNLVLFLCRFMFSWFATHLCMTLVLVLIWRRNCLQKEFVFICIIWTEGQQKFDRCSINIYVMNIYARKLPISLPKWHIRRNNSSSDSMHDYISARKPGNYGNLFQRGGFSVVFQCCNVKIRYSSHYFDFDFKNVFFLRIFGTLSLYIRSLPGPLCFNV